jgi:hypothetical protein
VGAGGDMLDYRLELFDQTSCRQRISGCRPLSPERKEYEIGQD